ncbi:MAG: InlB B-repeat-containing protein [Clostridium sp.]|nr:InlB B-repeat-containing protein [Acetatifactor muris]MCM1526947.1 InlB B-repeat-containing protein [Bacteroides sp.]MCM1563110.1 InlB B-repeat-containing protein [Clostridium sp.]
MKKGKGILWRKIMSVVLSAALVAGTLSGTAPLNARAAENRADETEALSGTVIPADEEWGSKTLSGTYTIDPGVTVTMTGTLTIDGDVTITGGGKLMRGSSGAYFSVGSGDHLTLRDIEIDGASLESFNPMINVTGGGAVDLNEGCRIHHCHRTSSDGAALYLYSSSAVFRDAVIENCHVASYGGAVYMGGGSSLVIYSGTYRENATISPSQYGGGFVYNRASKLEIYGGSFINNTSVGRGGCIYNPGIEGTETYLYGGYFRGNRSTHTTGSGAVFFSSRNTAATTVQLSGDVQFCGDGVEGSGTDGVFLDIESNVVRKAQISSELKYPLALYLEASEGRAIAEGVNGYQLQKKDMKKITFTDIGSSGSKWYAKLDEENNQVILTAVNPGYDLLYVTYGANGGEGKISDATEYMEGDTVSVQSGEALRRDGYRFTGWNTRPDGTGTAYPAGSTFSIMEEVTLYAQWTSLSGPHTHAVSVDCSQALGTQETFSILGSGDEGSGGGISGDGRLSDGSWYLNADMDLEDPLTIASGVTVNLCLNGHKLVYTGSGDNAIVVQQGGTLNLCDCNGSNGSHTFLSPATGENVTVTGGMITRSGQKNSVGSGIRVYGTMNMYGGSIAGISDTGSEPGIGGSHGAVRVQGTLHMYGGAITHNRSGCGGGVNVCTEGGIDAYFYLHGGSVSYNYADYDDGGGICLNARCNFIMDGGEIVGNLARSGGGGIECYGAAGSTDKVRIIGGVITGNTTGGDVGGGIKCGDDIDRLLSIGKDVRITGNTNASGAESNLYLCAGKTVNVESGFTGTVGVTTENVPTEEKPIDLTGTNDKDYSRNFSSDNSKYRIVNSDHVLQLAVPDTTPPTGSIKTGSNSWTSFLHTITFGLFFKETQTVTIEAADDDSGVDGIYYHISDRALSEQEIKALAESAWTKGASCSIDPDRKCVVYAKITDQAGNVTYISSNGLVLDATAPVISGVTDGETYRTPQTVTVTDENTESVKVDGREVSLTDHKFTLEAAEGQQTIVATDKAGNTTTVKVTVKTKTENVADARKAVQEALAGITATNETTKQDVQSAIDAALSKAGITDVTVTVGDLTRTDATTDAAGNISGNILIQCGDETDSVEIDKTIAKLPLSDADKAEAAKKAVQEALAGITATNETTKQDVQSAIDAALSKAGITDVTVTVGDLTRTDATTDAAGNISGNILIQCGDETDSVEIDKTIAKLPLSDADKAEAAKKAVQEALAGITATNETTKQDVQSAIDAALSKAGITDVTVTVGDLTRTDATTDAAGNISGNILIQCGDETDSVEIDKTIAKLPLSDADKAEAAKKAVQEALAGITATNETTKQDVQSAIDAALSKAGITDVTVTVGDLTRTDATTDAAGNISGNILIQCGDETDSVEIDKTIAKLPAGTGTEAGKVDTAVQTDGKAPDTQIFTSAEELKDMLLTEEEKQQVQDGTNIRIVLEVQDAGDTVSDADKTAIANALNAYTVGQYLNIDLYKVVGDDRTDITETTHKIRIVIDVPDGLKSADDAVTRTFGILRVHAGQVDELTDLDGDPSTITIETDRFSSYAIVYTDASNNDNEGGSGDNTGNGDNTDNGDNTGGGAGTDSGDNTDNGDNTDSGAGADSGNDNTDNGDGTGSGNGADNGDNADGDSTDGNDNTDNGAGADSGNDNTDSGAGADSSDDADSGTDSDNSDSEDSVTPARTRDNEPKTGDNTSVEWYATLAMIAGLTYLLLYFSDRRRGMTEETKRELVSRLVAWARRGGRIRKYLALAAIFALLVYYHSIGKRTAVEWKEICGE